MPYGTEVEYPHVQTNRNKTSFTDPAYGSHDLRTQVREDYNGGSGWPDGYVGTDPTAGLEVRSDQLGADELADWYRKSIVELSKYSPHEPCGVSANSRASTIGLHLHFSGDGFTEHKARALFEMSSEPWFKLFACSSLASGDQNTYQVFRSSYCGMRYSDEPSNDCVNRAEYDADHWEWRMLEPVTPDHFDLVMEFMQTLRYDGVSAARSFARSLVDDLDPRLTAVKRAQALDIKSEIETADTNERRAVDINRSPLVQTGDFFSSVRTSSHAPYIYTVRGDDGSYYVMTSDNYGPDDEFEEQGIEFNYNSVLDAHSLDAVTGSQADELRDLVEDYRNGGHSDDSGQLGGTTTSPATEALIDRLAATNGDN